MQCDDGMYCGDCSVELGTRLGDGCVQCRCVELGTRLGDGCVQCRLDFLPQNVDFCLPPAQACVCLWCHDFRH